MPNSSALALSRLEFADNFRLAALVKAGLPAGSLKGLARSLSLSLGQLAGAVQIPQRTLERRVAANGRLKSDESERALRLGRLFAIGTDVFEDEAAAAEWFRTPLQILAGKTPLELCGTEPGAREVEQALGRIEHGVFS